MTSSAPVRVLITHSFPNAAIQALHDISPRLEVEYFPARDLEDLKESWPEAEVLYTVDLLPTPEQAPSLRWVQGHFAGIDHLVGHPLASQVQLTTVSGIHTPEVGEYVMGMILAFSHHLPQILHYQARAEWPSDPLDKFVPRELRGTTLGIVGYGSLGREIARVAQVFGMTVLATKRDARYLADDGWRLEGTGDAQADVVRRIYPPQALKSMLGECEYVVLTVPLTDETLQLIGSAELKAMKPDSVLVNVSRGRVLDEEALARALRDGSLAGAALDVFETEPLPQDSPLWGIPNVIISPHVSGFTTHYDTRALSVFESNLRRYLQGETLLNLVDIQRGY